MQFLVVLSLLLAVSAHNYVDFVAEKACLQKDLTKFNSIAQSVHPDANPLSDRCTFFINEVFFVSIRTQNNIYDNTPSGIRNVKHDLGKLQALAAVLIDIISKHPADTLAVFGARANAVAASIKCISDVVNSWGTPEEDQVRHKVKVSLDIDWDGTVVTVRSALAQEADLLKAIALLLPGARQSVEYTIYYSIKNLDWLKGVIELSDYTNAKKGPLNAQHDLTLLLGATALVNTNVKRSNVIPKDAKQCLARLRQIKNDLSEWASARLESNGSSWKGSIPSIKQKLCDLIAEVRSTAIKFIKNSECAQCDLAFIANEFGARVIKANLADYSGSAENTKELALHDLNVVSSHGAGLEAYLTANPKCHKQLKEVKVVNSDVNRWWKAVNAIDTSDVCQ